MSTANSPALGSLPTNPIPPSALPDTRKVWRQNKRLSPHSPVYMTAQPFSSPPAAGADPAPAPCTSEQT
jgi:hypothetical protein